MFRRLPILVCFALACVLVSRPRASSVTDLELTISGDDFRINGVATFLPIISYFDAIHGDLNEIDDDFADLAGDGFKGVRIFPNWYRYDGPPDNSNTHQYRAQDTLFDKDGNLRNGTLNKLRDILDLAKDHGLIVDLSFTVETVVDCPLDNCTSGTSALTFAEYQAALEDITANLASAGSAYKHVMFDIQNEYDGNNPSDLNWDEGDMDTLAEAIHAEDSSRIVMASLGFQTDPTDAANLADIAELDVAVLHENRVRNWGNTSDDYGDAMDDVTPLPVYFQESPRYRQSSGSSDTTCWWSSDQAEKSLYEAKVHGDVAAWNFHTRAGFNLNGSYFGESIYQNFVAEEDDFVTTELAEILTCSGAGCPTAAINYDATCPPGIPAPKSEADADWLTTLPFGWAREFVVGVAASLRR